MAIPAIFVASRHALADSPGGQQLCTREYMRVLEVAGFKLEIVSFTPENGFAAKVRRRLTNRPYQLFVPSGTDLQIIEAATRTHAEFVFLNVADVAPVASAVKQRMSNARVVLLSHGLESVDYIHAIRAQDGRTEFANLTRTQELRLARQLIAECRQRQHIDDVICLAPFEVEIERWLGAKRVTWLPRLISENRLDWQPLKNRVGYVGRLDHPPNLEGLELFLSQLAKQGCPEVEVRLIGMPPSFGRQLESKYRHVNYLGALPDPELEIEAATWNCMAHPIFCYARGASTKLAVALAWGIPIVATTAGCRGYEWSEGGVTIADSPSEFAVQVLRLVKDEQHRERAAKRVALAAKSTPNLENVAQRVRRFLLSGENNPDNRVDPADSQRDHQSVAAD